MTCRTFLGPRGDVAPQVIDGHDPVLHALLLEVRRAAKRDDYFYLTHHCKRCGEMLAVTVGDMGFISDTIPGVDVGAHRVPAVTALGDSA